VTSRRRPWLAALLSFFMVGLGDAYNGYVAKGVRLAVLAGLVGIADLVLVHVGGGRATLLAVMATSFAIWGIGIARALRDARRLGAAPEPRRSRARVAAFVVVVVVATLPFELVLRHYRAWRVPSGSMVPTIELGDRLISDQWAYGVTLANPITGLPVYRFASAHQPRPGDVVIFVYPKDRTKEFIKRVVATGGQTVEVRGATVRVDGAVRDEPYAHYEGGRSTDFGPYEVPAGHVFVLGDNRNLSYDSRFWGPVPVADVLGRVDWIYWSSDGAWGVRWGRLGRRVR
jgi:signal peptidase I